ncbi:MAG: ribosome small subunit-dependent GTPase A [Acidobacteria bacterium]|nr:ribosome small subunit-dependent GTPase A [Acidobacteriota bacterium]
MNFDAGRKALDLDEPSSAASGAAVTARIVAEARGGYVIEAAEQEYPAGLSGRFRHQAAGKSERPVVGDEVEVELSGTTAVIHACRPRRTVLARRAAGGGEIPQVIAANIDRVFVTMGLDGDFNLRRLERFLVGARRGGAEAVVLLNKSDLVAPAELERRRQAAAAVTAGVPVYVVTTRTETGLDPVRALLLPEQLVCFIGSSGVGKSSIINGLLGDDVIRHQAVRENDQRGRHTTTCRQMYRLPSGTLVIDTPGMREFGLWAQTGAVDDLFPEIRTLADECFFRDCSHQHEPRCAVRRALEDGVLSAERYASFMKLHRESRVIAAKVDLTDKLMLKKQEKALHRQYRRYPHRRF